MTLRALNALLAAHGLALPNLGDIDAQTDRRRDLHRHPRHRRRLRLPVHLRRGAHPGHRHRRGAATARPTSTRTCSPPPGSASARSASLIEVTLRCVRRVRAARRTSGPAALADVLADLRRPGRAATTTSSSTGSPTPTGSRSRPTTGCRSTTGRCPAGAAGSTTTSCPTPSSPAPAGSAGRCPRWCRRSARSPPGR